MGVFKRIEMIQCINTVCAPKNARVMLPDKSNVQAHWCAILDGRAPKIFVNFGLLFNNYLID